MQIWSSQCEVPPRLKTGHTAPTMHTLHGRLMGSLKMMIFLGTGQNVNIRLLQSRRRLVEGLC